MEGVEYTAEVTLKNIPQDYKSSGAGTETNHNGWLTKNVSIWLPILTKRIENKTK